MLIRIFFLCIYVQIFIICFSCGAPITKTKLDLLYEKNFEGFEVPNIDLIKKGEVRDFPYVTFDQVWDSSILILMQQGIIVRSLKDKGIIAVATPPQNLIVRKDETLTSFQRNFSTCYYAMTGALGLYLALRERNKQVPVYDVTTPPFVIFIEKGEAINVYLHWMDNLYTSHLKPDFTPKAKTKIPEEFFDTLSTQIYAGEKWKYLFTQLPKEE